MNRSAGFWRVARRPRWILALLLALVIAGAFAALGQWQLSRSVESAVVPDQQTEVLVELATVAEPQRPVTTRASGQSVTVAAGFVPGDYVVLSDRINVAGPGYWVVGHAIDADGASLAVALGWAPDRDAATSAIRSLELTAPRPSTPPSTLQSSTLQGRYLPSESPQESDFEAGQRSRLAVSELINLWRDAPEQVYGGYLISAAAPPGLETIDAPPPSTEVSLNLLNIFYAVEWVIFAGFAVFLWYRLVRDAWEAEEDELSNVE